MATIESSRRPRAGHLQPLHSVRRRRALPQAAAIPAIGASPLRSFEALAGAMFVATLAAGWIAVASTATGPLVAAGELLTRVVRVNGR